LIDSLKGTATLPKDTQVSQEIQACME